MLRKNEIHNFGQNTERKGTSWESYTYLGKNRA
jgi:hypothetical protein